MAESATDTKPGRSAQSGTNEAVREALAKLRPQEREAVLQYTDPTSPNYGNKTGATDAAYPGMSRASAAAFGSNTVFKRPRVVNAVQTILDSYDAGSAA